MKKQLSRIARNRSQTGIIAEGEQDNADLWRKIRDIDEHVSHLVSKRIVQLAEEHGASILVLLLSKSHHVEAVGHSSQTVRHESSNGHGTAQNSPSRIVEPVHDITNWTQPPIEPDLRSNCSGKRLRWGVRSYGMASPSGVPLLGPIAVSFSCPTHN